MKKVFFFAAVAALLLGCKGNENKPVEPVEEPEQEEVEANGYFFNTMAFNGTFVETSNAVLYAAQESALPLVHRISSNRTSSYPLISWTPEDGTWPILLNVDYGETQVYGKDGLKHKGVMIIDASGRFEAPQTTLDVSFQDFYVYGSVLHGEQHIVNNGANEAGNLLFNVTVENAWLGENKTWEYSENTVRELISGLLDNGSLDPELTTHTYSITGTMKGKSLVDTIPRYEVTISEQQPMIIAVGDLYPVQGQVVINLDKPYIFEYKGAQAYIKEGINLSFDGRDNAGNYLMHVNAPLSAVGAELYFPITISFALNEDGIIEDSIRIEQ